MVIDLPEYDLYKEYLEDGSIDALMSCTNLYLTTTEQNPEIIMPSQEKQVHYMNTI